MIIPYWWRGEESNPVTGGPVLNQHHLLRFHEEQFSRQAVWGREIRTPIWRACLRTVLSSTVVSTEADLDL